MENKKFPQDYFTLVQENERLVDKELKTKQLSFFQDAMLRFTKNRYNVVASIILLIMILMSIFVPIITDQRFYTQTNSSLKSLPPRIPLIEQLGIMDGTAVIKNQSVDLDTIDPETGLGYPTDGYDPEFIFMDTLKNSIIYGSERDERYVGGTNQLFINSDRISYSFATNSSSFFVTNTVIEINIVDMSDVGQVEVYYSTTNDDEEIDSWDSLTLLGTITGPGVHTINPMDVLTPGANGHLIVKYVLPEASENGNEFVEFEYVQLKNSVTEAVLKDFSGYLMSSLPLISLDSELENGRFLRKNAEWLVAEFKYDVYKALFGIKQRTIGANQYNQILADNPGMVDTIVVNPDNPDNWTFEPGYPISEVISIDRIVIAGRDYTNYYVSMNGAYALGFESSPYFLFGTDVFGKDLFTLIWLGLRTSLLLGFMASLVNITVGIVWGAISAYYGGQVDILMERFTDIWGSFPQITMISIITVLIGPGFTALFIFMVYDGWIGAAKVTRSQFYRYKGREYVLAARTLGASDMRIIFKHILPNALGTIVTRVILSIPSVIFLEVNLSYLGFGIGNGQRFSIGPVELTGSSIGVILFDGQQQLFSGRYWMILWPTVIVSILMITFNMFGNALRDALNPQLRGSE